MDHFQGIDEQNYRTRWDDGKRTQPVEESFQTLSRYIKFY